MNIFQYNNEKEFNIIEKLKPCPFCGSKAEYERLGTSRHSCIVVCTNCGCRHESGDQDWYNGSSWNRRISDQPKKDEKPT